MVALKVSPPVLDGYEVVRHIGSGGFSEVFLYRELALGRDVAVKVLLCGEPGDEARAMAAVSTHAHVVDVYSVGRTAQGLPYLVMQYFAGSSLAQRLRQGALPVEDVLACGVVLAGAVESAHRQGLLHRDIKPSNVLTNGAGRFVLADFGIAESRSSLRVQESASLQWAAPEVLASGVMGVTGDVYSLAATLYTLVEGHSPFVIDAGDAENGDVAIAERVRNGRLRVMFGPAAGGPLEGVLMRAMALNPADRYQSAEAFGNALRAVQAELRLTQTTMELVAAPPASVAGGGALDAVTTDLVGDDEAPTTAIAPKRGGRPPEVPANDRGPTPPIAAPSAEPDASVDTVGRPIAAPGPDILTKPPTIPLEESSLASGSAVLWALRWTTAVVSPLLVFRCMLWAEVHWALDGSFGNGLATQFAFRPLVAGMLWLAAAGVVLVVESTIGGWNWKSGLVGRCATVAVLFLLLLGACAAPFVEYQAGLHEAMLIGLSIVWVVVVARLWSEPDPTLRRASVRRAVVIVGVVSIVASLGLVLHSATLGRCGRDSDALLLPWRVNGYEWCAR